MDDTPQVRIGTEERERAQSALNTHFSQGRLDMGELEERSSLVAAARTSTELAAVLHDLPSTELAPVAPAAPVTRDHPHWQNVVPALVPFVAVALYFGLKDSWDTAWLVFLLIPAAGVLFRRTPPAEPEDG